MSLILVGSQSLPPGFAQSALDGSFSLRNSTDQTKRLAFSLGGMTTGKTITLASAQTTNQTLNLPNITGTDTVATLGLAQTFTAAQSIIAAAGLSVLQASTQDAVALIGRAGGTSSYVASITPLALTASRTWSLPDRSDTFAGLGAQTFTGIQTLSNSTASTSTTTGALIVTGGCGLGGALNIGGSATINTSGGTSTRTALAGLSVIGGVTQQERYSAGGQFNFYISEGTVGAPAFPTVSRNLINLSGNGWVSSGTWFTGGALVCQTTEVWSASVRGTQWVLSGTQSGTASSSTWLTVAGGASEPSGLGAFGFGVAPTTGNGLLQRASGTTKASGDSWGGDTFLYRSAANTLQTDGALIFDGATAKTIKYTNGTANGSVATTLGSVGPTGSTAGNPQGWLRVNIGGTDRYIPYW